VAGALVVLVTLVTVGKYLHGDYKDAEVWYDAGRRVLTGQTLAGLPHYRYPPTFAVLIAPLTVLGFGPFFFLWYALNVGLFGAAVWLARGIAFPREKQVTARQMWLPALLVGAYAIDNLFLGQTNILVMVLVYWAFLEDMKGREWVGGIPLGAAIAIKAFPAPLLAYFVFRLRWRFTAATVLGCAFFLLVLPGPVRGFGRNWEEVSDWGRRVVEPYLSRGEAGDWGQHSLDFGNQSLPAVARRLLTSVDAQVAAREAPPMYVNVASLSERQVNLVVLALFAALGAAFVLACGLQRPRSQIELAVEYALATVMMLLVSALSWTYFFVMMMLPAMVATAALDEGSLSRVSRVMLKAGLWGLGVATALLASQYARALGEVCWAAVILFAAVAIARRRVRRGAVGSAPASVGSQPIRGPG